MKQLFRYGILAALAISSISCKDDDTTAATSEAGYKYALAFKSSSDGEPEFIVETDDLMTGTIDATNGIEQIGWRYFHSTGKTIFSSGYVDENICASYVKNEQGELTLNSEFVFDNALNLFGSTPDEDKVLAMEILYPEKGKNKLYSIDATSGNITGISYLDNYFSTETATTGYPTALLVRDDKLFIPFVKWDTIGNFTNPVVDTAFVAVYSYPNIKLEKIISDPRTGYIGVHGSSTGLIQTEDGTIYSSSSTSTVASISASEKPSGILKIKAGASEFDDNYFFDVEAATNGGKVFRINYIGDGKAFARIITSEKQGSWGSWTAYSRDPEAFFQKGVIIDFEAQTVTDIANLPLHASRYTAPIYTEDGKFYLSIETASDAYIYQVDIASSTATKGAKIDGKTVKGIFSIQ